jgi:C4-dicarboxylate-specific signal transduction histidine kinase
MAGLSNTTAGAAVLDALVQGVGQGLVAIDRDLVVTEWNRWMEIQTRTTRAQALGQHLCELYPSVRQRGLERRLVSALREGTAQLLSPAFHHHLIPVAVDPAGPGQDAEMVQYCRLLPVRDEATTTGLLILIEDYTERVAFERGLRARHEELAREREHLAQALAELEQADAELRAAQANLVASEKLKALVETAGAACHEMAQPLSAMIGNLQLAMVGFASGDPRLACLEQALTAARSMAGILERLRAVRRYQTKRYTAGTEIVDFERSAQ